MAYLLGDVFVGAFPITQKFGERPEIYSARYGMLGHNGVDFGCPSLTLVLAAAQGTVIEAGFDSGGYGNYIKLLHEGYLTLYGHLNNRVVEKGDHVLSGQLIGHSDNTGFSDAPHLHFGVAPCDGNGIKTEAQNGYSGYIDPMGERCHWEVKNLSVPVNPQTQTTPPISVGAEDLSIKSVQAAQFQSIVNYALQNGFGVYLSQHGKAIDLVNLPADTEGARKINEWIAYLLTHIHNLETTPVNDPGQSLSEAVDALPQEKKVSLLASIVGAVKGFVFK